MRQPFALFLCLAFVAPSPVEGQTIPAGKMIDAKLERDVTTESASAGDSVTALISKSTVLPAGSRLQGHVDFVQRKSATEDGWIRLLFNRVDLPDGRTISALASASFSMQKPRAKRDRLLTVISLGAAGALLGGHNKRVAAGLGGAIAGLIIFENKNRYGRDLRLRAGDTLRLRLGGDITVPAQ